MQDNQVKVVEEEMERYVGNPLNSLALVKRLTVELEKEWLISAFLNNNKTN